MSRLLILLGGLLFLGCAFAEEEFGFGGGGGGGGGRAKKKSGKRPGVWQGTGSLTLKGKKFSKPAYNSRWNLAGKRTPTLEVKIGSKQYYYPLAGPLSNQWITYKTVKTRGGRKKKVLVIDTQQYRVWYRHVCKHDTFNQSIKCGYCFKINYLAGILDYGKTKTVTISSFKFDPGALGTHKIARSGGKTQRGVVTKVTAGGESFNIVYATEGKFQGKFVIGMRGKLGHIAQLSNALTIYQRKYCRKSIRGYRCRWCFIYTKKSKTVFLPGPNLNIGKNDEGKKHYMNSPQLKKMQIKGKEVNAVRVIYSVAGSSNLAFFYYALTSTLSGNWFFKTTRGFRRVPVPIVIYTKNYCTKKGVKATCGFGFKMYKTSGAPKATSKFTVGKTTLKKPKVGIVKTPGLKYGASTRAAVFQGKYSGEDVAMNYAMDGSFAGLWFYVNTFTGKTKVFSPLSKKALYNWKLCKANEFTGKTLCRWCFMMVAAQEKASALPKGKVVTVNKAVFHTPIDLVLGGAKYTKFNYSKGKINKVILLKRRAKDGTAGRWFQFNNKKRLVPYDVSYDVYWQKFCTKFGKKTECRRCYQVKSRPNLAVKPIQPATSVTINGMKVSIKDKKLYDIRAGSAGHGKAHKFKVCKSKKCTYFYYVVTGVHANSWFSGINKKKFYFKTTLINKTIWKNYDCSTGLSGTVCRYCFTFT